MKLSVYTSLWFLISVQAAPFHAIPLPSIARRGDPSQVPGSPEPVVMLTKPVNKLSTSLLAHPWIPASLIPSSSRSPCPLLNTLANHGFINRNGRHITQAEFQTGIVAAINLDPPFAAALTENAFVKLAKLYGFDARNPKAVLDLEQLNVPNITEHDQSMTRRDLIQGDTLHKQPKMIAQVLGDGVPEFYPNLNTSSFGRTRLRRTGESLSIGSRPLRMDEESSCNNEAALVVLLLGEVKRNSSRPDDWFVRKERAGTWLGDEKFPSGWQRSRKPILLQDMVHFAERIIFWQNFWSGLDCGVTQGLGEKLPLGTC